jgi:hypothetical protein
MPPIVRSRLQDNVVRRFPASTQAALFAACVFVVSVSTAGSAQSVARFSLESVVEADEFAGESASSRPQVVVDVSLAVRMGDNWQIYVRPWFRLPRPNAPTAAVPPWDKELYQAGIRYERRGPIAVRLDAGYILSPIGLGLYDVRPGINPTIVPHLSYLTPMPVFDPTVPRVSAVSASYPLGAQLTVSTGRWDARAAVINAAPTRIYAVGAATNPAQAPAIVAGGGVTPIAGLRLGASIAHGVYATPEEITVPATQGRAMTMAGGEGEWAFGGTKLSAEWLRTGFETLAGTSVAYEWFVQGQQTLSARWFVAGRREGTSAPPLVNGIVPGTRMDLDVFEATAGFRVTPDVTLRGSYYTRRFYGASDWTNQAGVSVVWARRWW